MENVKSTELALGPHAGLVIKEASHPNRDDVRLVEVTHKRIDGFLARCVVGKELSTVGIFELFKKDVRLVA